MTQNKQILSRLKRYGWIDDNYAREMFGVRRLAARIMELRASHDIETEMVEFTNRHGHKGKFARYHLVS